MGYLELILGPMFSGKSSKLIQLIRKYKVLNKICLIIKPNIDNRYSDNKLIMTHDNISESCITCTNLSDISNDYIMMYDIIIIEEGQFFNDIYDVVKEWIKTKKVYIAGLNGDANQELFGNLYKLISHADNIIFLTALCQICNDGTSASFSKKNVNNNKVVDVGGAEMYSPVCRRHL